MGLVSKETFSFLYNRVDLTVVDLTAKVIRKKGYAVFILHLLCLAFSQLSF